MSSGSRSGDIAAQIYAQLREAILAVEIRPGEKTSQAELARDLGVGRTPMREAIRMLQSEGLVMAEPNQRVQIASLSIEDAEELYVARVSLEIAAARITTPLLTATDIAELEGFMAQMAHFANLGLSEFKLPHRAFHERLVHRGGARIVAMISELSDHAERYRRMYGGGAGADGHVDARAEEHRAIVDAAAAGDADAVATGLAAHYFETARRIGSAIDPGWPLDRLRIAVAGIAPGAATVLGDPA